MRIGSGYRDVWPCSVAEVTPGSLTRAWVPYYAPAPDFPCLRRGVGEKRAQGEGQPRRLAGPGRRVRPHRSAPAARMAATTLRLVPGRTFVKFTFFKLDPAWRRRDSEERARDKAEFQAACEDFEEDRSLRAYSTVGTRGDVDLLLLSQSPILEDIHTFHVVLGQSGLARWSATPYSYLAMTKPSPYSDSESRPEICTSERKYLFVYPFDTKREWYALPLTERQRIMHQN